MVALGSALAASPAIGNAQRRTSPVDINRVALAQRPKPFSELSLSALTIRDSIVALARAQVGKRYRLGGTSPDRGFDCSGLVKYVLQALQVNVPRTSREQSRVGAALPRDPNQLRPGDLVLFGKPTDGISHVGIYVGNGRFVHASSVAGRVIESPLDRRPTALIKTFKSARRVLERDEAISLSLIAARTQ
jgi:cell wall-associated NlpC family hydrolase